MITNLNKKTLKIKKLKTIWPRGSPFQGHKDAVQTFQFEQPINVKIIERTRPLSPKPSTSKSLEPELVATANRFSALEGMEVDTRPPPARSRGRSRGKASLRHDTTIWGDPLEESPKSRESRSCSPATRSKSRALLDHPSASLLNGFHNPMELSRSED